MTDVKDTFDDELERECGTPEYFICKISASVVRMKKDAENDYWVGVEYQFERINKLNLFFIEKTSQVPYVFIESLVILEDILHPVVQSKSLEKKQSLLKETMIHSENPENDKNMDALNSTQSRLKDTIEGYKDLVLQFKHDPEGARMVLGKAPPPEEEFDSDDDDHRVEYLEQRDLLDEICASEDGDELNKYSQSKDNKLWEERKERFINDFIKEFGEITWETVHQKLVATVHTESLLREIEHLTILSQVATTPAQKLFILRILVARQFEMFPRGHIPVPIWKDCAQNIIAVVDILNNNSNIALVEFSGHPNETKKGPDYEGKIEVMWNLPKFLKKIYFEFFWTLKSIKPDSLVYSTMLLSTPLLYLLLHKVHGYLEKTSDYKNAAQAALMQMEVVYYKSKKDYADLCRAIKEHSAFPENCSILMDELGCYIQKYGTENNNIHALLFDVYHRAIMDEFSTAESKLLTLGVLDEVEFMDDISRLYFNRAIAHLGLCAFRVGHIEEAHHYLSKLYKCGSVMEILGQGFSPSTPHEKTPEQEKLERLKTLPRHLHINIDLLDAVYRECAIATAGSGDVADVQTFTRPSINVGDHIMAVTGDFKSSMPHGGFQFKVALMESR